MPSVIPLSYGSHYSLFPLIRQKASLLVKLHEPRIVEGDRKEYNRLLQLKKHLSRMIVNIHQLRALDPDQREEYEKFCLVIENITASIMNKQPDNKTLYSEYQAHSKKLNSKRLYNELNNRFSLLQSTLEERADLDKFFAACTMLRDSFYAITSALIGSLSLYIAAAALTEILLLTVIFALVALVFFMLTSGYVYSAYANARFIGNAQLEEIAEGIAFLNQCDEDNGTLANDDDKEAAMNNNKSNF